MKRVEKIVLILLIVIMSFHTPIISYGYTAVPSDQDPFDSGYSPEFPSMEGIYNTPNKLLGYEQKDREFCFTIKTPDYIVPLSISFPKIGGVRIHGEKKGSFEAAENYKISYTISKSGDITMKGNNETKVVFQKKEDAFKIHIYNGSGERILGIDSTQMEFAFNDAGELIKYNLKFPLDRNKEEIYGSGERFNELSQVGKRLKMWNLDASYHGDDTLNAELWRGYKNIPLLHSSKGYTLFFNTYYAGTFDIGYSEASRICAEFKGAEFDFYLWTDAPKENLKAYTELTGKSILLPKWAYEYSAGGSSGFWNSGKGVYGNSVDAINGYKRMGTPNIASVYLESASKETQSVYDLYKSAGIRVLKWNSPNMTPKEMKSYLSGMREDELPYIRYIWDKTASCGDFIDFTQNTSTTALIGRLSSEVQWGAKGGLVDFGELIQPYAYFPGVDKDGAVMHNEFAYWYSRRYCEAMSQLMGNGDFVLHSRSAAAGSQAYTAFFTGDQQTSMEGLRRQLAGGISASVSGLTTWGGDIGGLSGGVAGDGPTTQVFARSMQFSTFQPLMRTHGTTSRFPWDYGALGESTYKTHYWLRENILNKIYSTAIAAHKTGSTIVTPLTMEYSAEQSLGNVYETYLFCDDFLVTPVLKENAYLYNVMFPQGNWYSLWTGEKISGCGEKTVESPIDKSPIYLRAGALIPVTVANSLNLTDSMQDVKKTEALLVTKPDNDRTTTYYRDENTSISYKNMKNGNNGFVISAETGNDTTALILKGTAAGSVVVDGKSLKKLTNRPTGDGEIGYYSNDNRETIINIGTNDWSSVEIENADVDSVNLMKDNILTDNMKVTADGDFNTALSLSEKEYVFELSKTSNMNEILVKWTDKYAKKFKVAVSENGNDWTVIKDEANGYGGITNCSIENKNVKYVKLYDIEAGTESAPEIYEIEAYGNNSNCCITYNLKGGAAKIEEKTVVLNNSQYTLPSKNRFTAPQGKQFKWYLINGKVYNPGDVYRVIGDTTIFLVWEDYVPSDENDSILASFDGFYSSNATTSKKVKTTDYWSENTEGIITRKAKGTDGALYNGDPASNMAMLYYNANIYKDFVLELEYRNPVAGMGGAYVGFGGKIDNGVATTWKSSNAGTIFGTAGSSEVKLAGNFEAYGGNKHSTGEEDSKVWTDWVMDADWGTGWNAIKLEVKSGHINCYVKVNGKWIQSWKNDTFDMPFTYGDWYDGGYVYIASNNEGTQFRNIKISDRDLSLDETVAAEKNEIMNQFDSYYTSGVDKKNPEYAEIYKYWTADTDGVLTRKDIKESGEKLGNENKGNPYPEMAILYYDIGKYKDFTMIVDYYNPVADNGGAWIGFDGEKGESWYNHSGNTMINTSEGNVYHLTGTFDVDGETYELPNANDIKWTGYLEDGKFNSLWNTVKIEVKEGKIKFFIQVDNEWKSLWNEETFSYGDWYDGGYIFLVANNGGTKFRNLQITGTPIKEVTESDLKDFTAYYSPHCQRYPSTKTNINTYWSCTSDGVITRKARGTTTETGPYVGNCWPDMSMLYYDVSRYKDFTLEVEYRNPNESIGGAWIGFDGEINDSGSATTWYGDSTGTVFATDGNNSVRIAGTFDYNGRKQTTYNTSDSIWRAEIANCEWKTSWMKAKLEVKNGFINFYVDVNGKWETLWEKDAIRYSGWYDGGYVYIASNNEGTQFRNFKITGEALEEETTSEIPTTKEVPTTTNETVTSTKVSESTKDMTTETTKVDITTEIPTTYKIHESTTGYLNQIETKRPGRVKIKKINIKKKHSKKVKIYLLKVSGANGYQIRIYTSKKRAKKNKKALITKNIKSFRKVFKSKKLKNKKRLYVKARAYRNVGKIKIYGRWSKIKKVRIR